MSLGLFCEAFLYTFFVAGVACYSTFTCIIITDGSAYKSYFEEWAIITIILLVLFCVLLGAVYGGAT